MAVRSENIKMDKLKKYRKVIDKIDYKIFRLLLKRLTLVKKIKAYKKSNGIKILDKSREKYILKRFKAKSKESKFFIKNIFKSIIKNSRVLQK